jgi:two-component system, LuxR family, sensor kinase FixL
VAVDPGSSDRAPSDRAPSSKKRRDERLPDGEPLDGWAWTRDVCRQYPDLGAVVVGIDPSPETVHRAFEVGADDVILDGFQPDHVQDRFRLIEQYAASRARPLVDEPRALQQAVVAEVGRRALAGTELEVLMAHAVRSVSEALDVEMCKVLQHDAEEASLLMKAGVGWSEGMIGTTCVPDGEASQAGYTLQSREPIVVENVRVEDRFDAPDLLAEHGAVSGASVVISSTPRAYGILGAHSTASRTFSEDDVYFLQSVANVLAGAVERTRTEQALRESEARASSIIETTVDGIITIDDAGTIQSFNAAAEEIFGYTAREVIGKNVKVLMPSPYQEEHDGYMRSYHDTGRRRIIGIGREVTGQRKDGSTFPMDLAVSEIQTGSTHTFTGIVRDIRERRRLEKEILDISEQERRRIGQDLHDGLGQMLTGIGLLSQNLNRQLKKEDSDHIHEAEEITELMKEADQYARDLARGLTPVDLEANGLSKALQRLSDNAERLFGVECSLHEAGTGLVHNAMTATHLYRIAQEAVSNAVRHGDADQIRIAFASGDDQIRVRVQDDGVGFDIGSIDGPGMGVHIMNYRARIIGGTLEISSTPDGGTTVTCTLPGNAQPDASTAPPTNRTNRTNRPSRSAPPAKHSAAPPAEHGASGAGERAHGAEANRSRTGDSPIPASPSPSPHDHSVHGDTFHEASSHGSPHGSPHDDSVHGSSPHHSAIASSPGNGSPSPGHGWHQDQEEHREPGSDARDRDPGDASAASSSD